MIWVRPSDQNSWRRNQHVLLMKKEVKVLLWALRWHVSQSFKRDWNFIEHLDCCWILMDFMPVLDLDGLGWNSKRLLSLNHLHDPYSLFRLWAISCKSDFILSGMCSRLGIEWVQKILLRKQTRYKTGMTCWTFMEKKIQVVLIFTKI